MKRNKRQLHFAIIVHDSIFAGSCDGIVVMKEIYSMSNFFQRLRMTGTKMETIFISLELTTANGEENL